MQRLVCLVFSITEEYGCRRKNLIFCISHTAQVLWLHPLISFLLDSLMVSPPSQGFFNLRLIRCFDSMLNTGAKIKLVGGRLITWHFSSPAKTYCFHWTDQFAQLPNRSSRSFECYPNDTLRTHRW